MRSSPVIADTDLTLYHGDALETLRQLPDGCVDMVATSPPFYGLRDYQTEGQIGLEETIDEWTTRLCNVFDECRRVMADHATCWIEIGDSFDNKQLVGQPWRLAFALQARGWFLRSEIIWHKVNAMPESVTDRPTKAHSTIFLLAKQARYYFDAESIREPHKHDGRKVTTVQKSNGSIQHRDGERWPNPSGANTRSVWSIPTEPTPFAHFATWPQALIRRMILAGTSERGKCPECGKPWVREEVEATYQEAGRGNNNGTRKGDDEGTMASRPYDVRMLKTTTTLGWSPSCACDVNRLGGSAQLVRAPVPCVVLDPFAGSGTTLLVARALGRHSIGIELNADYCKLVAERTQQLSLLTEGGET